MHSTGGTSSRRRDTGASECHGAEGHEEQGVVWGISAGARPRRPSCMHEWVHLAVGLVVLHGT
jgi:hypothetical protein